MNTTDLSMPLVIEAKRRIFEESYVRIHKCLDLLTEEQVWQRPNEQLSSVGNLILHLCGNARQWVLTGLGGQADHRMRDREFLESSRCSKWKLKRMLDDLKTEMEKVFHSLNDAELKRVRPVQVFEESGLSILIHVIEHFSYHTGQITWFTKFLTNEDTKYYGKLS